MASPTTLVPARSASEAPARQSAEFGDPRAGLGGELLEIWLPPLLLLISWTVGWLASWTWMTSSWLTAEDIRWALLPTMALLVLRVVLERTLRRTGMDSPTLIGLYSLHVALTAIALLLNPMTCIYAFTGYIDSGRFVGGARSRAVVVSTALLCAVGQVGGLRVVVEQPWFFLGLAVVNLVIATGMMYLAEERERVLAQREAALAEILRVQQENARLQDELLSGARRAGADEERARLSREIHDTVAQGLVGVIRQLEAVSPGIDADSRQRITLAEEAARDSLLEARRAVEALGPHQLRDADLVDALAALVARWARSHRVVATFDADDAPRGGAHAETVLRIAQESLANISRHAAASTVTATLAMDGSEQLLRITDDGIGFDPERVRRGHGLSNMHDRLRDVEGRLEVHSAPGQGATIVARVPR